MIARDLPAGPGMVARVRFTEKHDGDFRIDAPPTELEAARRAIIDRPWTWLRQVHGSTVVGVDTPGAGAGSEADGAVTSTPGVVLAVQTADCAPVVLAAGGCVAVAHVGWRGLVDGVLERVLETLRERTDEPVRAVLGPCIHAGAYEFGSEDLERVVDVAGSAARGRTVDGRPALDVPAAIAAVVAELDVADFADVDLDTSDERFHSHRTRGDTGRQATVTWLEPRP
jgi:YfiH family protein